MASKCTIATLTVTLLIASLVNVSIAAAHANLGILDGVALFDQPNHAFNPGFGPRFYATASPPIPAIPLYRRQESEVGHCTVGNSCLELGPAGADACCSDDRYCYLNTTWGAQCCSIGNDCKDQDSPCDEDHIYCNATITSTTTIATSPSITALVQTSLLPGCCPRSCSTSSFLCQKGFGGQCCGYGEECRSGGSCFMPATTPQPTVATIVPSGCTTSQISCETGGGCCNFGSICTSSSLAATVTQLCVANLTVVDNGGSGLSDGARVGIGVGIAVGAAIIIGGVTWFWIHRRRVAKSREGGPHEQRPFVPQGGANTDITSPSNGMSTRPRIHETGLAHTYYGPDAVPGPFTDRTDSTTIQGTEPRSSPGFSERAMNAHQYPENPGDVRPPVEMGTEERSPAELGGVGFAVEKKNLLSSDTPAREEFNGPFELYGSPGTSPQPMNPEEAEEHRTNGISPSPPPAPKSDQQGNDGHK
ncbi:uncharacterized protein F4822DRAFT_217523 [Hypoxylon trugodes]|uniref:uncharacterized protein n=1 Tax=Hypoxylon trugodes TaxID=326681 RepID=UPI0021942BC2|nr:uncharacterized protein F4822DRAFT_217523 [Hypoxylon trugodes]KAI1389889.1 hypothetical protein F4822DRAFT_217523 [Hypoxylon trugodes]